MMNSVYLLTGGNLGDRNKNLSKATVLIEQDVGEIVKKSSIYETASWGINDQPDFLNMVLLVKTNFSAAKLLQALLTIENKMGRQRSVKNASRIIDIDILFFNDEVINKTGLTIPHPEIHNRMFVLIPLDEIAGDFIHPVLKKPVKKLLSTSPDKLKVTLLDKK